MACTWKIGVNYKAETVNLLPNNIIRLAQSILKRKSPSKKKDPQKGPLKNISPWTYFRNFTVFQTAICTDYYIGGEYKSTKLLDKRCWSKQLYTLPLLSIITLPHIYVLESEVLVHKKSSAS